MSQHAHHAIDVHSHYFPQSFLDLIEKHGPSHGFEYQTVEGKGPRFKHGHLVTGPVGPKFVDLDTRLRTMDEQGVEAHALRFPNRWCIGRGEFGAAPERDL